MTDDLTPAALSAVQSRIEEIADQAGIEGHARLSVDDTLAALPWVLRRRLVLMLQSLKAFSPDPAVRAAADFFQIKAAKIWAAMPFQGHQDETTTDTTVLVEPRRTSSPAARGKKP
ncbi:hypothetical protein [Microvirga arabica]|uniref:hypothetical protein n=1 Tax=Microvirga arabica TaxID=1128671 RepID=UPI001939C647|nr:hypothetical protein [Microvirga arabica]MBM1172211.1 hypothetical protein [Microvirga arabica]